MADPLHTTHETPIVTIITATLNSAKTLRACLQSVASQDYPEIEHLVMDGASTDGTVDILREEAGGNVVWHSERDVGIYDAWNRGLARARGEWIAFLGGDDVYLPGAVSAYMRLAAQHPEAQYLSGQVQWRYRGGTRTIGRAWKWPDFRRTMMVAHVGSMHHRSLFAQYGTYDTSMRIVGDYEFLLRAGSALRTAYLAEPTAEMLSGGASDSIAALREVRGLKQAAGIFSPTRARLEYAYAKLLFLRQRWIA